MPSYTYTDDPSGTPRDTVRVWLSDIEDPWILSDEENAYWLAQNDDDPARAAAAAARAQAGLSASRSGLTRSVGDLTVTYGRNTEEWLAVAAAIEDERSAQGTIEPDWVNGSSSTGTHIFAIAMHDHDTDETDLQ